MNVEFIQEEDTLLVLHLVLPKPEKRDLVTHPGQAPPREDRQPRNPLRRAVPPKARRQLQAHTDSRGSGLLPDQRGGSRIPVGVVD